MFEFILPDLGEGIHEAEVVAWHVDIGATVGEDENLVDVETDKATVSIPSPVAGVLKERAGEVGDTVLVGKVLAVIDTGSGAEAPAPATTENPEPGAAEGREQKAAAAPASPAPATGSSRLPDRPVPAAPATRRLARELGLDINRIPGSGPAGRVTPEDLRAFADSGGPQGEDSSASAEPSASDIAGGSPLQSAALPLYQLEPMPDFSQQGPVEVSDLRSIRRKTARKMVTASLLIPHVSHFDEADVSELEAFRRRHRPRLEGRAGSSLTMLAFVVKAVTRALKEHPSFNASVDAVGQKIIHKQYYNIGVAVAAERGLMVPVIPAADAKSIIDIAATIEDLAGRARDDALEVADLRASTFTVTNIGSLGGKAATPIINHPEVGILAMGRAEDRPVVRDGEIVIRSILPLVLSFDHRVADGADAARFVNRVVGLLEDPEGLLLES